jgi:deoxyribodipyrimidine photo-lyase
MTIQKAAVRQQSSKSQRSSTTTAAAAAAAMEQSASSGTAGGPTSRIVSSSSYIFHWFRHGDLRLADNPALMESVAMLQREQQQQQQKTSLSSSSSSSSSCSCIIVPMFVFDSRLFGDQALTSSSSSSSSNVNYAYNTAQNNNKHLKTGVQRAKFLLESVHDLQGQLRDLGSGLAVVHGDEPAAVFDKILTRIQKDHEENIQQQQQSSVVNVTIVCQQEVYKEERDAVAQVQRVLKRHCENNRSNNKSCFGKVKVQQVWGSTVYELSDLPFESSGQRLLVDMPDVFTPFRNKVEQHCTIKRPVPAPTRNQLSPLLPNVSSTTGSCETVTALLRGWMDAPLPTLQQLGYTEEQEKVAKAPRDERGVMEFCGGERAALARLHDYIWTKNLLKDYFDTRNGMLGADYSTKLSPWLAMGCISPRTIALQCRNYETSPGGIANKSTYWLVFELLIRDYCKFFAVKHGDVIFRPFGTIKNTGKQQAWSRDQSNFDAWKNGKTGYPLVDANMREMMATGFMSNRGRQNVCSFLAIDLHHDWRCGADWFESQLVDYDVYSNWYNWAAGAGMTGGRLNRFNIVKQSKDYDANGDYVRTWLPELANVPNEFVHEPWKMTQFQQLEYGCILGVDYPNPIIPPFSNGRTSSNKDKSAGGGGGVAGSRSAPQKNRQRQPNRNSKSNPHQTFEMKSVKQGNFRIDK